jgi:hypothetical protein
MGEWVHSGMSRARGPAVLAVAEWGALKREVLGRERGEQRLPVFPLILHPGSFDGSRRPPAAWRGAISRNERHESRRGP